MYTLGLLGAISPSETPAALRTSNMPLSVFAKAGLGLVSTLLIAPILCSRDDVARYAWNKSSVLRLAPRKNKTLGATCVASHVVERVTWLSGPRA